MPRIRQQGRSIMTAANTWNLGVGLAKSVTVIRRALQMDGLNIVEELDVSASPNCADGPHCVVLLVDSPELLFEAIALDRGAAVLVPVHIVVTGDAHCSQVHWANPIAALGLRAPASARVPIERLCAQVKQALSRALDSAAIVVQ